MTDLPLQGRRILVVEDDYLIAHELASLLEEAGATILGPVPSVEDALALLDRENDVDGAVLDMNLAGTDVLPVADALSGRQVPFMFTTGYNSDVIPARYAHVPYCGKPLDVAKVPDVVARLISG